MTHIIKNEMKNFGPAKGFEAGNDVPNARPSS
jgi:hypothetical protein